MNNNLKPSSHARCSCGRYATIDEWKAGVGIGFVYECPDCSYRRVIKYFNKKSTTHLE